MHIPLLFIVSFIFSSLAFAQAPFVYQANNGPSFTVTADGLSSITLGGREVAKGNWRAMNAEWAFNMGAGKVDIGEIKEKSLEILAPDHARVRHVHKDAAVIYDYAFAGEDVAIKARVENNHPTERIRVVGFSGLQFAWQRPPKGYLQCAHVSYLRAHVGQMFHPGMVIKVGGSFGADETLGVGTTPLNSMLEQTLTMWDYADWTPVEANKNSRENNPRRNLQYYVAGDIAPESARTFGFKIRVSANTDWKYLLAPYKDYFQALLGPVRYTADNRPLIQMCVNKSAQYITPDNPYGYHEGAARLDTAAGVKAFCDQLIPLLKQVSGQGVIIWGQQGTEIRGAEYRPDFDVMPPETEANWKTLQERFKEAGLKLGVATRPDSIAFRVSWKSDGLVDLNPNDPAHLDMLWRRFKNMIDKGCTMFYLDSFGTRPEDVQIIRYLREQMGPEIQTYSEMSCDAILPYTGLYCEVGYQRGKTMADAAFNIAWLDQQTWDIFRFLAPGLCTAVRPHIDNVPKDADPGLYYRWMLARNMTPLEQPGQFQTGLPQLKLLLPEFLDDKGRWRK